ncbi:MAG: hypothetical protein ACKVS8_05165 [Phycisphaerales bacterium]
MLGILSPRADVLRFVLVAALAAILPLSAANAQPLEGGDIDPDLPPPVLSEARSGIDAEHLLFEAADKAYPAQYNIAFSFSVFTATQQTLYRIGWHGNPAAQGAAVPFGDLVAVHTYDTPNYALLQQSWSSMASEMLGMQAAYAAFRYEGARGVIYGVAELNVGIPIANSPFLTMSRVDIVSTTATQAEAVAGARSLALEAETKAAADWLGYGLPRQYLAGGGLEVAPQGPSVFFNEAHQPVPTTVPTPLPMFRLRDLFGFPQIITPPGEGLDLSCDFEASFPSQISFDGPENLPFIAKPINNDFKAEVIITSTGRPCVSGNPGWIHRLKLSGGTRGRGRFFFDAKIDGSSDDHIPCPNRPDFLGDKFSHSVLWSVQYHEAIPLRMNLGPFQWDLTGVPSNILYDRTLMCVAGVECGDCPPHITVP